MWVRGGGLFVCFGLVLVWISFYCLIFTKKYMFHVKHTMLHKDFNWEKIKLEELIDLATVFIYLLLIFPT